MMNLVRLRESFNDTLLTRNNSITITRSMELRRQLG